ncbi:hypothetical protein AB0869_07735 [Micromonospora vinacea]
MRIRRVLYAVAVGAMLAVTGLAAPAHADGTSVAPQPILHTFGWDYPG